MATTPVKSQPLHNFSLPFLGWGGGSGGGGGSSSKNQAAISHRFRRPPLSGDSPSAAAADNNNISEPDSESDTTRRARLGSRTARNRFNTFASCSLAEKSHNQQGVSDSNYKNETEDGGEAEETVHKPWNLRPRRGLALPRAPIEIGGVKNGDLQDKISTVIAMPAVRQSDNLSLNQPKSMRLRGLAESVGVEKKEKRKFWISLSRDEIEEDIFVMTGSRPARRPMKRPKNVQKQLDNVFPGLWLVGVTADAFRVADSPAKR